MPQKILNNSALFFLMDRLAGFFIKKNFLEKLFWELPGKRHFTGVVFSLVPALPPGGLMVHCDAPV
jgi:hypothetical protein